MRFNHPKGTGFYSLFATGMKYLRTASGAPPLTIAAALNERYRSMTLYGSTQVVTDDDTGVTTTYGVGDRTENLFDGNNGKIIPFNYDIFLEEGTYSLSYKSNNPSAKVFLRKGQVTSGYFAIREGDVLCIVFSFGHADYLRFSSFVKGLELSEIMLIKGEYTSDTMPAYEPYGYKIPVNMESERTTYSYNLYTTGADSTSEDGVKHAAGGLFAVNKIPDTLTVNPVKQTAIIERHSKAENGEVVYAETTTEDVSSIQAWDKIPKLDKGEIVINVGTEVKPDKITVEYFTKYKPLTTEDGIMLTTEDGIIIGGIS